MPPASESAAALLDAPVWEAPKRARPMLRFWALLTPHVLLTPALGFGVTLFHELAHAAAALAVGGEVIEFSWLPSATNLGHMRWVPPTDFGAFDVVLVSVAPYLLWSLSAAFVLVVAWRPRRLPGPAAATLFVWAYAVPIGDIAGNLLAPRGDLSAPGIRGALVVLAGGTAVLIAWGLGWLVQRRLFPQMKLSGPSYLVTTLVMGGAWVFAMGLGLVCVGPR